MKSPVFYTLVRNTLNNYVEIFFYTISLTPVPTPVPNLVDNSWWNLEICRLTLLQEGPHHVFAQNTKEYHQFANVLHPSAQKLKQLCQDLFETISLTPVQTPFINRVDNAWWNPEICRPTLLQEGPHHVFAQNKKEYHQFANVLHPSAQ